MLTKYNHKWQKPPCGTQINRAHPLANGMVACWLLNEGAGNVANDSSGNGNTMVAKQVGAGTSYAWISGAFGSALSLVGNTGSAVNGSYFQLAGDMGIQPGPFSMLSWGLTKSTTTGGFFIGLGTPAIATRLTVLGQLNNATVTPNLQFGSSTSNTITNAGKPYTLNRYLQECATFTTPTSAKLYANGVNSNSANTVVGTPVFVPFSTATMGGVNTGAANATSYPVIIDHAIIWNRALTPDEVAWLYQEPFAFMQSPSVRRWFIPKPAVAAPPGATGTPIFRSGIISSQIIEGGGIIA